MIRKLDKIRKIPMVPSTCCSVLLFIDIWGFADNVDTNTAHMNFR